MKRHRHSDNKIITPTSPGRRSSVALCSARSGGERDLTIDCWDCCCFSCCNLLNLLSASVNFCCTLANWARCSPSITSSFSFEAEKNNIRQAVHHPTLIPSKASFRISLFRENYRTRLLIGQLNLKKKRTSWNFY